MIVNQYWFLGESFKRFSLKKSLTDVPKGPFHAYIHIQYTEHDMHLKNVWHTYILYVKYYIKIQYAEANISIW